MQVFLLFLIILVPLVPAAMWLLKTPRGGWRVSNKPLGHTFPNGKTVVPGYPPLTLK